MHSRHFARPLISRPLISLAAVSTKFAEELHLDQDFFNACSTIPNEYQTSPLPPAAVSFRNLSLSATEDVVSDTPRLIYNHPNAYSDFYGNGTICIFKSGPPWPLRAGSQHPDIIRDPRPVNDHPIAATWLSIGKRICTELDSRNIDWTCINPLAYANAREAKPFCPLIVSIGVTPDSLNYPTAVAAADAVKNILAAANASSTIEVAFVEWIVYRSVKGPKLLSFDPILDKAHTLRMPFTPTLGLSIASLKYPYYEGTGALYFRLNKDDDKGKCVALLTCAHVARPPPAAYTAAANLRKKNRYYRPPREEFVALGVQAYDNAIKAMMRTIGAHAVHIVNWNQVLNGLGEPDEGDETSIIETREEYQGLIAKAKDDAMEVNKLHDEVTKIRTTPSQRVIGRLLHSEPIEVSVEPHGYTKDWALIELYNDVIDWPTFKGNKIYIGGNLSVYNFRTLMFPHPADRVVYNYPVDSLLQISHTIQDDEIRNPQHLDANGNKCLHVIKNGLASGTTAGKVNSLQSFTRCSYPEYGINQISIEFAVVASDRARGGFSDVGDSGSIVLSRDGGIVGLITGGAGPTPDGTDVTYITPYWWIEEQIKAKYPDASLYEVV